HPLSTVVAGPMLWDLEASEDVLRFYDDFIANAPDELGGFFLFMTVPPGPPFPEEFHLRKMCGVAFTYAGSQAAADEALAPIRDWARDYYDALHPYSDGGAYVNMLQGDEGDDRVRATYGANYDRLAEIKRQYDPDNFFQVNQNIAP